MQVFHCPTKIYTGTGALNILREFQARRVLIVTDSFFSKNGTAGKIGALVPGAEVRIFDKVTPDPQAALAAEGAAVCVEFQPDLLMALGGGSPMDCAKGIRMAYGKAMQFVAIPTTSGSGSEMTSFSILTHNGVKHPLVDPLLRPDAAILDDTLLDQLPKHLIADTGMDLLAHCLEALVAKKRSELTDAMAMHAAQTVLERLPASFSGDRTARLPLHEAACMAGIAFDQAGLGVCHALAHAIGGRWHVPHGRLCAILLPAVLDYNAHQALQQYARLARRCGFLAATDRLALRQLGCEIVRLRKLLKLPGSLIQAGIPKVQWLADKERVFKSALADPCCGTNPIEVTLEGLEEICRAVIA